MRIVPGCRAFCPWRHELSFLIVVRGPKTQVTHPFPRAFGWYIIKAVGKSTTSSLAKTTRQGNSSAQGPQIVAYSDFVEDAAHLFAVVKMMCNGDSVDTK